MSICERWHHCTFVGQISPINRWPTHGTDTGWTCWPSDMPQLEKQGTVSLFVDFHVQQRSRFGLVFHSEGPNTEKKRDACCVQLTLINSPRHDESGSRQTRQGSFQIWHRPWLRSLVHKQKRRRRKGKPALQVTIMAAKSQTDSFWDYTHHQEKRQKEAKRSKEVHKPKQL